MTERDHFATEYMLSARRRSNLAIAAAGLSLLVAAGAVFALVAVMPLRETRAFVIMVDPETGISEQLTTVRMEALASSEALTQANLVAYVTDRETFDRADAQERIETVLERSTGTAASDLVELFTPSNPAYPPSRYGANERVTVEVLSVTEISKGVAQVRFRKTLHSPRGKRAAAFVATVGFDYEPREERSLETVWRNPLGFRVTSYRVDAETLAGAGL